MPTPRVIVLRAPGTNCDVETAYAFEHCGAAAERVHLFRVLERPEMLRDYQILCIPGGFSYGDDVGAGAIFGGQLRSRLSGALRRSGVPVLGLWGRRPDQARHAAFFLPYVKTGMTLLDCGCGPGSLTVGLAQAVGPGMVVGIDCEPGVIARAKALGQAHAVPNVVFHVADVCALPFATGAFDAVFAHTLLQHLRQPVAALRAMHRVLRPGGVAGIRTIDVGGQLLAPPMPELEAYFTFKERVWQQHGSARRLGRHLRSVLRQAGFGHVEASASYDCYGTAAAVEAFAQSESERIATTPAFDAAIAAGWIDRATLDTMRAAWQRWAKHPDAFYAMALCEAVGWKASTI
jgi:ubiquinone/menaquinone biosynthesis C-methylase UbiE